MPKGYTVADNSINNQLIKIRLIESHSGTRGNIFVGPFFLKCCILVYFVFLSDGGASKCCGAWGSLLPPYPTFSAGLIKMHSTHSWIKCVLRPSISYFVVCYFQHKNI